MQRAGICLLVLGVMTSPALGADVSGTAQASGRPAQSAVIWLDTPNAPPLVQTSPVVLDQRNLAFSPQVLAVRVGTSVDFPNHDRVFHNVFSFRDGKKFDLGMYPAGVRAKLVVFDRPGLSRIFCNIHPNMAAYVMALDTPFYAVSDERGTFTISAVPPGIYTYHAWRSGGETLTGSVTVGPARPLEIRWP